MENYDIIVVGGGWSGVNAAISAARQNLKVLIVEKYGFLGGASTVNLVNPFMPYTCKINGKDILLSDGIFTEIRSNLYKLGGIKTANGSTFNQELLKIVLDNLIKDEKIDVLFHTVLTNVEIFDKEIKKITVFNESGFINLKAKVYIDATGNGDLLYLAKLPYQLGREEDNLTQPMTLCFWISNVKSKEVFKHLNEINNKYKEYRELGLIKNPREDVLMFYHVDENTVHFNSTRVIRLDPTNAIEKSKAEVIAREQMYELYSFLKENFECFKNSELLCSATEIGIRESRKLIGEYILNSDDVISCTKFDDGIACCNYDIDIHNPNGTGTSHNYFKEGEYYTIPYRCLYNKDVENLLVTGRCISGTHEAEASYRIIPTVSSLGEAAGIAAAYMVKNNTPNFEVNVKEIQQMLRRGNFYI